MSIDWEWLLDAEGEDLQDAYDALDGWDDEPVRFNPVRYSGAHAAGRKPVTESQRTYLYQLCAEDIPVADSAAAHKLIDKLLAQGRVSGPTEKMAACLSRHGFKNVRKWTFAQAHGVINYLAVHGWKLPAGIGPSGFKPEEHPEITGLSEAA